MAVSVIGCALGVCCLASSLSHALAAAPEETAPAATLSAPASDPTSPDAIPFVGNVELKARLDAPGKLTIAGERMHATLLRRFYAAHEYRIGWDAHPARSGPLARCRTPRR